MNNKTAIIVLNWNGLSDTLECLASLETISRRETATIVIVDNGSLGGDTDVLQKYTDTHPHTVLLKNIANLGFAGGVNTGIRYALKQGFSYIALINNDAVVDANWLTALADTAQKNQSTGAVTSLLLHRDGSTIDSTGDWYSHWGLPFPRGRGEAAQQQPQSEFVFGATGGATLYKAELFNEIGVFDEDFFAYYEDVDISFRAQLAGWKVKYEPKAIAYHKQGATSDKIPGFTVYQTFKNLPLLYLKNVPRGLLLHVGIRFYFAYTLMYFNTFTNGTGLFATKGAWKAFILGWKKIFVERSAIQRIKKVSASYIKSILWDDLPPDQTGVRKVRKFFIGKS